MSLYNVFYRKYSFCNMRPVNITCVWKILENNTDLSYALCCDLRNNVWKVYTLVQLYVPTHSGMLMERMWMDGGGQTSVIHLILSLGALPTQRISRLGIVGTVKRHFQPHGSHGLCRRSGNALL